MENRLLHNNMLRVFSLTLLALVAWAMPSGAQVQTGTDEPTDTTQTDTTQTQTTFPIVLINGDETAISYGTSTDDYYYYLNEADQTPTLVLYKSNALSSLNIEGERGKLNDFRIIVSGTVNIDGTNEESDSLSTNYKEDTEKKAFILWGENINLTIEGDSTSHLGLWNAERPINLHNANLTIKGCEVTVDNSCHYNYDYGDTTTVKGNLTVDNATFEIYHGNIENFNSLNLVNTRITKPAGGKFVKGSGIMTATDSVATGIRIEPIQEVEITPVATDSVATDVVSIENLTNETGSLDGEVIDNVYFSINNSGDDATQTGYYDETDKSIVVTTTTETSTVDNIASAEDPLEAAANSNYTGMIFELPAGRGTITLETQTFGTIAVAVQVGTNTPQTITAATQTEKAVSYDVSVRTYVYVYTTTTSSAAKATRATTTPSNGAKIYSVKVKKTGEATGIKAIENGQSTIDNSAPMYNLAGQRVGSDYKGIVIQNGKKYVKK